MVEEFGKGRIDEGAGFVVGLDQPHRTCLVLPATLPTFEAVLEETIYHRWLGYLVAA